MTIGCLKIIYSIAGRKIADAKRDGSGKENVMVSRRNFATITIMLVILLFMFQFTGVMKDKQIGRAHV